MSKIRLTVTAIDIEIEGHPQSIAAIVAATFAAALTTITPTPNPSPSQVGLARLAQSKVPTSGTPDVGVGGESDRRSSPCVSEVRSS